MPDSLEILVGLLISAIRIPYQVPDVESCVTNS